MELRGGSIPLFPLIKSDIMKVKIKQRLYCKGAWREEGDVLNVSTATAGAWIQTGKADELLSKKAVRAPKREQVNDTGGEPEPESKDGGAINA